MNGIVLLMLMATAGQVGAPAEAERDFGWEINKKDNVLEYIIQLSPEKVRDMQQKSIAFPLGQENLSDIPPQLVGRATRVVIRIGDAVLPRTPSLQELERLPRSGDPVPSSTAQLGPGRISDVEPGVYNIQGNGQPPSLPDFPNASLGTASGLPDLPQSGNLIDEASRVANNLRDGMSDTLSGAAGALPSSPDLSMLAQNTPNPLAQNDNAFLQGSRGASSKFNNTGTPTANSPLPTNPNLMTNPTGNAGSAISGQQRDQSRWGQTNSNVASGAGTAALPGYPGSAALNSQTLNPQTLNPPSLNQYSNTLPQQQTPTPTFGSSPTYTGSQTQVTGANAGNLNFAQPGMTSLNGGYSQNGAYTGMSTAPTYQQNPSLQQLPQNTLGTSSFSNHPNSSSSFVNGTGTQNSGYDRLAMNNNLGTQSQTVQSPSNQSQLQTGGRTQSPLTDVNLPPSGTVDGILQVFFLLSLVVNFYLGLLIRKLLTRYRSLLMNVRSQTA